MPSGVYKHRKWTKKEKEKEKRSSMYLGRKLSKETREKIGKKNEISIKEKWKDGDYKEMMSNHIKPFCLYPKLRLDIDNVELYVRIAINKLILIKRKLFYIEIGMSLLRFYNY